MIDRTATFLQEEIQEDVPTGVTPRKKVWNVPTTWERTEPREVLIAAMKDKSIPTTTMTTAVSCGTTLSSLESDLAIATTVPLPETTTGLASARSSSNGSLASDTENHVIPTIVALPSITGMMADLNGGMKISAIPRKLEPRNKQHVAVLGEGGANIPRRVRKG